MEDIDALLSAIENQTRREILKRLVEGRQYALQLAKDLRVSQQAIVKHLNVLERSRIVRRTGREASSMGPPRKMYEIGRSFSIVIDVAPGIFEIRRYEIEDSDEESIEANLTQDLDRIEKELRELEKRRIELLKMKERILRQMQGD